MSLLQQQTGHIPLPEPTSISEPFWDGCREHKLLFQRCKECGHPNFDPVAACRRCLSTNLDWEESRGEGSVYSWTVVWRPQTPAFTVPYAVIIIDMDEGYQMLSSLIDCDSGVLAKGLRVEVDFREMSDTITLPYFRPVDA
jgi:uncharacterized OB-fold protein